MMRRALVVRDWLDEGVAFWSEHPIALAVLLILAIWLLFKGEIARRRA
jgi:hypothetical protein